MARKGGLGKGLGALIPPGAAEGLGAGGYQELPVSTIRPNRYQPREHFPALVFDTVIPRNVRIGEAPSFGRPVIHHDPHCVGADAYFELAKEVAARG